MGRTRALACRAADAGRVMTDAMDRGERLRAALLKKGTKKESKRPPRLTPAMEDIWTSAAFGTDGSAAFTIGATFEVRGPLDPQRLAHAVEGLAKRHDAFGLRIDLDGGKPVPHFDAPRRIAFCHEILPDGQDPLAWTETRLTELETTTFDLATGPLAAITLLDQRDGTFVLNLVISHAIADHDTVEIIIAELWDYYIGEPPTGPAPSFADFLSDWDSPDRHTTVPHEMAWPVLHRQSGNSLARRSALRLTDDETTTLLNVARGNGVTAYGLVTAAFQAMLARFCGQDDVTVGAAFSLRDTEERTRLVGMVVETGQISAEAVLSGSLVSRAMAVRDAMVDLPALIGQRSNIRMQATSVQYASRVERMTRGDLVLTRLTRPTRHIPGDVHLSIRLDGAGLVLALYGRTYLFSCVDLDACLSAVRRQLILSLENVHAPMGDVDLVGKETRAEMAAAAVAPLEEATGTNIAEVFEAIASKTPDAPAIRSVAGDLTYRELNDQSNALAATMTRAGLTEGAAVAITVEPGRVLIEATLAVLKCGAVVVPIDPAYSAERRAEMLRVSGCRFHVGAIKNSDLTPLPITPDAPAEDRTSPDIDPDALAYILFTSGSTGAPKGVELPHRAILRLAAGLKEPALGPGDCMAQLASPSFDGALIEIWGALLTGAALAVPEGRPATLTDYHDVLNRHAVTDAFLSTGIFRALLDAVPEALSGLNWLTVGGEALPGETVARCRSLYPGLRLTNGYGPTENGAYTTMHETRAEDESALVVPIGAPLPGNAAFVLDAHQRPVPDGFAGELYVGGPGLARGYAGLPERTAASFLDLPKHQLGLAGEGTITLYRTGDRVRRTPDGPLQFLGRITEYFKFNGHRIEPAEIAAALRAVPGVEDAAVIGIADTPGLPVRALLAVYTPSGAAPDTQSLRHALAKRLPRFQMPTHFSAYDSLPLTPNGKLDTRRLHSNFLEGEAGAEATMNNTAPDPVQRAWAEMLPKSRLSDDADFFLEGGNSLSAMQLLARLERDLGQRIAAGIFMADPRLGALRALTRPEPIEAPTTPDTPHLHLMRDGDPEAPPIIVIFSYPGDSTWAHEISKHMKNGSKVWGTLFRSDGEFPNVRNMDEFAKLIAIEILSLGHQRPVSFLAHCFGGPLAVLIADHIEKQGYRVAQVILLDSNPNFLPIPDYNALGLGEISELTTHLMRKTEIRPVNLTLHVVEARPLIGSWSAGMAEAWTFVNAGSTYRHSVDFEHIALLSQGAKQTAELIDRIFSNTADHTLLPGIPLNAKDLGRLRTAKRLLGEGDQNAAALGILSIKRLAGKTRPLWTLVFLDRCLPAPAAKRALILASFGAILRQEVQPATLGLMAHISSKLIHPLISNLIAKRAIRNGIPQARTQLILNLFQCGLFNKAKLATQELMETPGYRADGIMLSAILDITTEKLKSALVKAQLLFSDPETRTVHLNTVAHTFHAAGQKEIALALMDEALNKFPYDRGVAAQRKRFLDDLNQVEGQEPDPAHDAPGGR